MTSTTYRTVFEFGFNAWQIHRENGTIATNDDYHPDHEELAEAAIGKVTEHTESWSARITGLDPIHTALRIGDAVYCDGYGDTVYVLREAD